MVQKKERLRLIYTGEKKYLVPLPKFLESYNAKSAVIKIGFKWGRFHYFPRRYTFMEGSALSSQELRAIADELDRLNKDALVSGDEQC